MFGHNNHFVVGTSFDYSVTRFSASAELGTIGSNYVVSGSGIFLGQSGDPVSIGPVSLRTTNQYNGIYALDTFDVTNAFSLTGGGRFNYARIELQDQIGTALNGNETFTRFNPIIGGTYKITSDVTAYAGYSEANRVPTPLELGCADPAHPCIIAAFLVSDPPLKQVVSRTVEAGFRGSHQLNIGTLSWKLGGFRATNSDDILAIPSPALQGFGYFQNVGSTRRQGIEAQVSLQSKALQLYASYALVDARFLDSLQVGSNSPFADADGNVQISPGNRIPAIPRNRIKAGFDYSVTDAFKVGGDALFVSDQYFVGDESNQAQRLPSYAVFNAHASYQVNKTFQIYGRVDNIFDNRYATYGTFFDTGAVPNFTAGPDGEFRQWRRGVQRPAFAEPGAAACVLCRVKGDVLGVRLEIRFSGQKSQAMSGEGPPCCALWMADGTNPKYLRNTRLKCDELEKPHENATSVMVFPAWVSSSWRQCCSLARQM